MKDGHPPVCNHLAYILKLGGRTPIFCLETVGKEWLLQAVTESALTGARTKLEVGS